MELWGEAAIKASNFFAQVVGESTDSKGFNQLGLP
jgi:hypothetical protein